MEKLYRWLRVIEYVGPREWLDLQVRKRGLKGSHNFGGGEIREVFVGDVPLVVGEGEWKPPMDLEPPTYQQVLHAEKEDWKSSLLYQAIVQLRKSGQTMEQAYQELVVDTKRMLERER